MTLTKYPTLIATLPTGDHSLTIEAARWHALAAKAGNSPALASHLNSIFAGQPHVAISRDDLLHHPKNSPLDFERFIIATLMWGYPSGGRGNNICNVLSNLSHVAASFHSISTTGVIPDWGLYLQQLPPLPGLGLSTHTKLLYFMGTSVQNYPALIIDARIKEVIWSGNCREFTGFLRGYSPQTDYLRFFRDMDTRLYVEYLSTCDLWARNLSATNDQIEFFLFTFGRILK